MTPCAATGLDEYFAECVRAYVDVNDAHSPWPKATRERLARVDPAMHEEIGRLFREELRVVSRSAEPVPVAPRAHPH